MQNQKLRTTLTETQAQVAGMSNDIQGIKNALAQHSEVLTAIIAILGEDTVTGEIDRLRAQRQAQQEQQQADGVKKLVEQGILKVTDISGVKSFIVGTDTFKAPQDPAQKVPPPRRLQFEIGQIKPELQANYIGKKVGDTVDAPDSVFTINEVYDVDVVKAVEQQQAAQKAQQEAQAAAAAGVPAAPPAPPAPVPPTEEPVTQGPKTPAAAAGEVDLES